MKALKEVSSKKSKVLSLTLVILFFFLVLTFSGGCSKTPTQSQEPNPIPSVPPVVNVPDSLPESFEWNDAEWDRILIESLKKSKLLKALPSDRESFHYSKADSPLIFWSKLLVEMAKWESNYQPTAYYLEKNCSGWGVFKKCNTIYDRNGDIVASRGLFQLSLESGNGYGCGFVNQQDVHSPEKNIQCAVKILEKWILADGKIYSSSSPWKGGSRYWGVLRPTTERKIKAVKAIKEANK